MIYFFLFCLSRCLIHPCATDCTFRYDIFHDLFFLFCLSRCLIHPCATGPQGDMFLLAVAIFPENN